jgi:preprotein translocase subunit Sec63
LIRQIRELEKIPIVRTKGFDPTETMGFGLLNEMSVAELRERLEYKKLEVEDDRVRKLEEINRNKEDKVSGLMNQAEKIANARR